MSETWEQNGGEINSLFFKSIVKTDEAGFVYVAGSTMDYNSNNNKDIMLQKFHHEGYLMWEVTYDGGANLDDFAADLFIDNNGNVFVTGTAIQYVQQLHDLVVLKYNSSGTLLWDYFYHETALDGGSSITGDDNGFVYVAGGSQGVGTAFDYVVLALDESNGALHWETRYDYNNLDDAAAKIIYNTSNDFVYVVGASQRDANPTWEMATLEIDAQDGQIHGEDRSGHSVQTIVSEVFDIITDINGFIYITGSVWDENNSVFQLMVYKFNQDLDLEWERSYDNGGLEAKGTSLYVDNNSNVYVTGYRNTTDIGHEILLLKFNSSGTLQWERDFGGEAMLDDEGKGVIVDDSSRVIVTGAVRNKTYSDYVTVAYSEDGELLCQAIFSSDTQLDDVPQGIAIDADRGRVVVTGKSEISGGRYHTKTVQYKFFEKSLEAVLDPEENPSHNKDELIIRFDREAIHLAAIDRKAFQAGILQDFVKTEVIQAMSNELGFECKGLETYKIFRRMTTADSLSVTRLGDTIKVPDFWATLSVYLPISDDPNNFDYEQDMADILTQSSDTTIIQNIHYTERNFFGELASVPNDDLYPNGQTGLYDPTHGINVEEAWVNHEQFGQNFIRVGVYDSGINWRHQDFGGGTRPTSKVRGGWDFYLNNSPFNQTTPDPNGHGTAVAGIIGALRNNNEIGIAGIAGGDIDNENNSGVELFSMKINIGGANFTTIEKISSAIVEGAVQNANGFGYGFHIQNHSWKATQNSLTLENSVKTCYEQSCLLVAASGNSSDASIFYPASYNDNWVLKVGANDNSGKRASFSTFGNNLDVIAPGTTDIYSTLDHNNNSGYSYSQNGTSFAAPHAAGVAALLQSEHHTNNGYPNNLSPEDIEVFLQSFATDITSTGVGYDQHTGYGRINADLSLERIILPQFFIKHSGGMNNPLQSAAVGINVTILNNINGIAAGNYIADRYQVTSTFVDIFNPNQTVISHWKRYSSSVGVSAANPITGDTYFDYTPTISQNVASVTTTTYCWFINQTIFGQNIGKWIPDSPSQLKTAYSLYVQDEAATKTNFEKLELGLNIYPNPTTNQITIDFDLVDVTEISLEIFDATGRVVATHNLGEMPSGFQSVNINISNLSEGLYICNIQGGGTTKISKKIIKH